MIYEYMLNRKNKQLIVPEWVEDGGYFYDTATHTMLGWSPNLANREYYIPDSVVVLTKQDAIDRVLAMHHINNMLDVDNNPMSDADVTALVSNWYDEKEAQ